MKYILIPSFYGQDVWTSEGKITLSAETTQKQLQHLHEIGHACVIKAEGKK